MATQEELEFQALLNQAMAGAGQAPADMPVQAVDPVRAERLAFEASQGAPVASVAPPAPVDPERQLPTLNDLQSNVDRIQALSLQKQAALQEQALLAQQRPNQRFLNKDQSFMDAFRNPGAGQRDFALKAGLSLLSSGGTQDLSQRIGHALGAGVQGMQAAREAELAKTRSEAQSRFKQFGIQEQAERDLFNLNKEIVEEQRLAQPKAPTPSAIVKNYAELAEARKSGNDELARILQAKIDADTATPPEERSAFDEQLGKKMAEEFTTRRTKAIETAQNIPVVENLQKQLEEGIISGTGANFRTSLNKALNTLGFDYNEDVIANTEAFAAAQAAQVAQIIKAFGAGTGLSDADREFALKASGGDITMSQGAIRRILKINLEASRNIIKNYNKEAETLDPREMGLPYSTLTVEVPTGLDVKSATDEQLLEGF